jgi:hypothetical protein
MAIGKRHLGFSPCTLLHAHRKEIAIACAKSYSLAFFDLSSFL